MSSRSTKLPASERKEAILVAAAPVFARLGPSGATTKEIAKAAGVSESLLYRHFPSKEVLYAELEKHCVDAHAVGHHLFDDATPSTETLVMGVAVLVQAIFVGIGDLASHENSKRFVTTSLLGDGQFAKAFLDRNVKPWIEIFERSLRAARAAGDLEDDVQTGMAEVWFVHHLSNTLHLLVLPGFDVVDHGMAAEELASSAIHFLLRGLGLTSSAISRCYKPQELKRIIEQVSET